MISVPPWLTLLVATMVAAFGVYRIYIARTSSNEQLSRKGGLYGRSRKAHLIYGIIYLVLAAILYLGVFGVIDPASWFGVGEDSGPETL